MKLLSILEKPSFATNRLQLKLSFVISIVSNNGCKQHVLVVQMIVLIENDSFPTSVF